MLNNEFSLQSADDVIFTSDSIKIEFDCQYSNVYEDIEANEVNVIDGDINGESETGLGSFTFSLKQYTDSGMTDLAEAGYKVALGAKVFYQLEMQNAVAGLDWVLSGKSSLIV